VQGKLEEKRAKQNEASAKISQVKAEERDEMIADVTVVKKEVQELEDELKNILVE
jgi:seryl-tRNA synthetase